MADINPRTQQHTEIRKAVRDVCSAYDSSYWQKIEEASGYPDKFIQALVLDGYVDSFDMATKLADDLLTEQAVHLPQFKLI